MTNSVTFKITEMDTGYRTDIPTPAEYQPMWCIRRKCFYTPDPLYYNKLVEDVSQQMVDEIDEIIFKDLLEMAK